MPVIAETSFHVRYVETDAMQIVHHTSYIVYFEEGRSAYARQRGGDYAAFEATGRYLAVAEMHARYVKPARYGQMLTIRCWISELKSRTVRFEYEILNTETHEVLVTGYSKHICINREGQVAILPNAWRAWGDNL